MTERILICTDLDRTLLPNGSQPESPHAREIFAAVSRRDDVELAYVSGRHRDLVMSAIHEYSVPLPDYVIGDVGTSIYTIIDHQWQSWPEWHEAIAPSWNGHDAEHLASWLTDLKSLRLQEESKQNIYKLSYYTPASTEVEALIQEVESRLASHNVRASVVWSLDDNTNTGLLDILPAAATKRHAIEFLMQARGFDLNSTLFAGDSGNDLAVLTSPICSVLVANASESVRMQALSLAQESKTTGALYLAQGNFMKMNGNYSAGILEGLAHYFPQSIEWLAEATVS